MKELIIQLLFWVVIIIAVVEMYVDYKANKFMIDMIVKKYPYRIAGIAVIIIRSLIIMYL